MFWSLDVYDDNDTLFSFLPPSNGFGEKARGWCIRFLRVRFTQFVGFSHPRQIAAYNLENYYVL